jgi:hypothetical protein
MHCSFDILHLWRQHMCGNRSWHTYAMHPALPLGKRVWQRRGGDNADGSGPRRRERGSGRGWGGWHRQVGPTAHRESEGAHAGRLGQMGRKADREGVWAAFCFSFYFEFLIPFLFISSIEFKFNQTTNSNLNILNMCINQKQSLSSAWCNNSCLP